MKVACLAALLVGCAGPRVVAETPLPPASTPLPSVSAPEPTIPLEEVGKGGETADWIDLAMPDDARVLSFRQDVREGRETWTLTQAGTKRVLRVQLENARGVSLAAFVGETTKEGMAFRLVELRGEVRFSPERALASCTRETVCEEGKTSHRVVAEACTFAGEGSTDAAQTWLAPGRGVDFAIGTCPRVSGSAMSERYTKRRHPRVDF